MFIAGDTISYLSYSNYTIPETKVYLIKNNTITDTITKDYSIRKMTPVPLSTEKKFLFVALCKVPETDVRWHQLIGINTVEEKFKIYQRNRVTIKNNQIQY